MLKTRSISSLGSLLPLLAVGAGIGAGGGCSKPGFLISREDAGRWVRQAHTAEHADCRREAVLKLADSRFAGEGSTVHALCTVARTDPSEQVRCVAVRALGKVDEPRAILTLIAILGYQHEPANGQPLASVNPPGAQQSEILPAGDELRLDAIGALTMHACRGESGPEVSAAVREVAIRLVGGDPSRDVRIAAARLLGQYPHGDTVTALVGALRQADFGVVYEAERSLRRLTGVTFGHHHARWVQWLESTDDLFANRGALDETLGEPRGKWWWPWTSN